MPTNILRKASDQRRVTSTVRRRAPGAAPRIALLTVGRVPLRLELADTATADLVWNALPLFSAAELWGAAIKFETPLEAGRDRTARVLATPGEVYFWVEHDRIFVPFGRTPISKPGECRLPSPCNLWARSLDDVTALSSVRVAEKVSLRAA